MAKKSYTKRDARAQKVSRRRRGRITRPFTLGGEAEREFNLIREAASSEGGGGENGKTERKRERGKRRFLPIPFLLLLLLLLLLLPPESEGKKLWQFRRRSSCSPLLPLPRRRS